MNKLNKEILEQLKAEGIFVDLRTGEVVDDPPVYGRIPIKEIDQTLFKSLYDQYINGKLFIYRYSEVFNLNKNLIYSYLKRCGPTLSRAETSKIYRDDRLLSYTETCLERYKVDNVSKLEWVQRKKEDTHEGKTGYKYYIQSLEGRQQFLNTMMESHGVDNPSKLEWVKEKKAKTFLKSCGETNIFKAKEFKDQLFELRKANDPRYAKVWEYKEILETTEPSPELITEIYSFLEREYQYTQRYVMMHFLGLFERKFSRPEVAMKAILESIPVEFESHVRGYRDLRNKKGNQFELDFLIGDNLAIEVNGLYTHSVAGPGIVKFGEQMDGDFHFFKFKECYNKDITLLSFTDIEIYEFPDFVRDVVRFHLGEIDEVGIPEGLIERLNFKDLNEIDKARCYCLTPTKDLDSIELRERAIDGFTYIDAGFQK